MESSYTRSLNVNYRPRGRDYTFVSPTGRMLLLYYYPEGGRISPCLATAQPTKGCHT